jgi:26S proteasome non-ATPase regulatory subunit 10
MALSAKELVNQQTKDGNSPLMWAAWSSSLDTVKLMVRYRARWDLSNRNGCTVAHWAASGGNLEVCKYLAEVVGVDFFVPNHGGNTPLTHAVAFGRLDVVQWLRERAATLEEDRDDLIAKQLVS